MPPGRFVDAMALLVLTTASLRAGAARYPDGDWDGRRFRPNILVDAAVRAGLRTPGAGGQLGSTVSNCYPSSRVSAARW